MKMDTSGITGHGPELLRISTMLENHSVPQTMVFSGIPGIGKRKTAIRLLSALAGTGPEAAEKGLVPDIITLSPNDKGTIPVGDDDEPGTVRWLISRLEKKSSTGRYGVLIDGMEHISDAGQNALLKILEEPPLNTVIIMITSSKRLILPTILSRAVSIGFRELSPEQVLSVLREQGISGPEDSLCAQISGGSPGLAGLLLSGTVLDEIRNLVRSMTAFVSGNHDVQINTDPLQKKLGADLLVFLLTCSFRYMFRCSLSGERNGLTEEQPAQEISERLIKILLSVNRTLDVNMLLNVTLKAFMHQADSMPAAGLLRPSMY